MGRLKGKRGLPFNPTVLDQSEVFLSPTSHHHHQLGGV